MNKQQATSNKQQATSNKQQATSNKQQATSNKQQATSNKLIKLATAVMVLLSLNSCTKEKITPLQPQHPEITASNPYSITLNKEHNLLAFSTAADYEKVIHNPTEQTIQAVTTTINNLQGFTSLKESNELLKTIQNENENPLVKEDYFSSMLNTDNCIQIGKYIYRINAVTKKVFVLPAVNSNNYADLVNENLANTNIKLYSTNDDVLELVENGVEPNAITTGLICRESGIGAEHPKTGMIPVGNNINWLMQGALNYNKFGIYFSLFAEAVGLSDIIELSIDLEPVYYHVRCGKTQGAYNVYGESGITHIRYQSYQGSKALNEVNFRGMFRGKVVDRSGNVYITSAPSWLVIRKNC